MVACIFEAAAFNQLSIISPPPTRLKDERWRPRRWRGLRSLARSGGGGLGLEGEADADAGRVVSHEEVCRWLLTWGTPDYEPPPAHGFADR